MRLFLVFIGLFLFYSGDVAAGRWLSGWVELESGDTLQAEIRDQKYFTEKIVCCIAGVKERFEVNEVKSFEVGEEQWKRIEIAELDGQLVFARVEISETLFEAKITEVKCTCDDSYQSRKVWIWKYGNELFVFKKRHFTRGLINWDQQQQSIARHLKIKIDSLPGNLKFDDVPEFVSGLN